MCNGAHGAKQDCNHHSSAMRISEAIPSSATKFQLHAPHFQTGYLDMAKSGGTARTASCPLSRNSIPLLAICCKMLYSAAASKDKKKIRIVTGKRKSCWRFAYYNPSPTQRPPYLRKFMRNVCSSCSLVACRSPSIRLDSLSQRVTQGRPAHSEAKQPVTQGYPSQWP